MSSKRQSAEERFQSALRNSTEGSRVLCFLLQIGSEEGRGQMYKYLQRECACVCVQSSWPRVEENYTNSKSIRLFGTNQFIIYHFIVFAVKLFDLVDYETMRIIYKAQKPSSWLYSEAVWDKRESTWTQGIRKVWKAKRKDRHQEQMYICSRGEPVEWLGEELQMYRLLIKNKVVNNYKTQEGLACWGKWFKTLAFDVLMLCLCLNYLKKKWADYAIRKPGWWRELSFASANTLSISRISCHFVLRLFTYVQFWLNKWKWNWWT